MKTKKRNYISKKYRSKKYRSKTYNKTYKSKTYNKTYKSNHARGSIKTKVKHMKGGELGWWDIVKMSGTALYHPLQTKKCYNVYNDIMKKNTIYDMIDIIIIKPKCIILGLKFGLKTFIPQKKIRKQLYEKIKQKL